MPARKLSKTPLAKLRQALNYSQDELVAQMDGWITRSYLSKIERGECVPSRRLQRVLLEKLSALAGKTITARSMKWE